MNIVCLNVEGQARVRVARILKPRRATSMGVNEDLVSL